MRGFRIKRVRIHMPRFSWPGADVVALSNQNNLQGGGNDLAMQKMISHYGIPGEESRTT